MTKLTKDDMLHSKLTKHDKLTFHTLEENELELLENALAVPSLRGDGVSGHAYLVLGPTAYTTHANGTAFIPPTNPGTPPVMEGLTTAQIATATSNYKEAKEEWNIYTAMKTILKSQILECVNEKYYSSLVASANGISNLAVFDILTYLRSQHIVITDQQLRDNRDALLAPWSPDDTMEPLWLRIRNIVKFAEAGDEPIPDGTLVRATKKVLLDTGVFTRAVDMWNDKPKPEQTWPHFQTHFVQANLRRLEDMTATDAGLGGGHAANAAVTVPAPVVAPAPVVPRAPAAVAPTGRAPFVPTGRGYCWTHGLVHNTSHTSLTCVRKAPGHRDDATAEHMLGGNNTMARHRNEPAVYRHPTTNPST